MEVFVVVSCRLRFLEVRAKKQNVHMGANKRIGMDHAHTTKDVIF